MTKVKNAVALEILGALTGNPDGTFDEDNKIETVFIIVAGDGFLRCGANIADTEKLRAFVDAAFGIVYDKLFSENFESSVQQVH